jgi:hypothetical protein
MASHGVGEVERHVEDGAAGKTLVGELVAGSGGGGDGDDEAGERGLEAGLEVGDEALGGQDFSDGDGVEPDGVVAFYGAGEVRGNLAETSAQAGPVSATGDHAPEPPGGADGQREREEGAIEDHAHELGFDLMGAAFPAGWGTWGAFLKAYLSGGSRVGWGRWALPGCTRKMIIKAEWYRT